MECAISATQLWCLLEYKGVVFVTYILWRWSAWHGDEVKSSVPRCSWCSAFCNKHYELAFIWESFKQVKIPKCSFYWYPLSICRYVLILIPFQFKCVYSLFSS